MIRFFCKKQMLYQTVLCRRRQPIKIIKVKILSWSSLQETFSSTFDVDVDDDDLVSQVLQKRTAGGWGCYELRHVLRDCLWIFCILCAVVLLQDLSFQMINGWWCFTLEMHNSQLFNQCVEVRITLHDNIKRSTRLHRWFFWQLCDYLLFTSLNIDSMLAVETPKSKKWNILVAKKTHSALSIQLRGAQSKRLAWNVEN